VVAAAIAQWAAAGASAGQLALLHSTTFSVDDLVGDTIGEQSSPAHISIDTNAAGHGWFIDPTPADSSEFTHAANAAATDLFTDPTTAAAGHLDLLTTVVHEMGHVLGLPDLTVAGDAHDLMYINLVNGERRLPDAADAAQAKAVFSFQTVSATPPPPPAVAAAVVTDSHPDFGGIFGGGLAKFVFSHADLPAPTLPASAPLDLIRGGAFGFAAFASQFHAPDVSDATPIHAGEQGFSFAMSPFASNANAGSDHGVFGGFAMIANHMAFHFAQNPVDLLV